MAGGFTYFVILAGMRTGSNLLEETLNQVEGVTSHAELFNPVHLGGPNRAEAFGLDKAARDADPMALLQRLKAAPGLNGFRYFDDHDPRVMDAILTDPACAKIILTRNPLDSYVSLLIARKTGRWRASDVRKRKVTKPAFDAAGFNDFLDARRGFHEGSLRALQVSGQTGFYLDYEDVQSFEVINGLLSFLGVEGRVARISRKLIPQNPEPLGEKVSNHAEMARAVSGVDWAGLGRYPNFEPRRGPGVPRAVATTGASLLYLPIAPFPDGAVRRWMTETGGGLVEGMTQSGLRDWMRERPGFRSFTILCHPLRRAYAVFRRILEDDDFEGLRLGLETTWGMARLPDAGTPDVVQERAAFLAFLRFLRANLNGQTPVQQHALWASQLSLLQGMAQFAPPDLVARVETIGADLAHMAGLTGLAAPGPEVGEVTAQDTRLRAIRNPEVEAAAHAAYGRDYQLLGYACALN